ncbi:beta-galactosidase [bacterium]|nr:MAG: beta-galactosidase [bacterium]
MLPFRQIHLDFHIHEAIPGLARNFNPHEFAATLERASVNSVTCFARCHHGWMYYASQQHPDRIHPNLQDHDLLKKQIEACHARGIRVPIYTTVQWDHQTAQQHPEWVAVAADGAPVSMAESMPYEAGFYRFLCLNSPYRDWLKAHVRELLEVFPVTDGLFFDIVWGIDCSCRFCRAKMREGGFDARRKEQRLAYARQMIEEFTREMTAHVREFNADCSIYYNSANIGPGRREPLDAFTHLEFDALPSDSQNGYMNFPRQARFERNLGKDCVGMTGKFHRGWGDIHSFKNRAALEYDCFQLLAFNCKCLIGDQLDPSGLLDSTTYDLVGAVYSQVAAKEAWCEGARALVDIGLLSPAEWRTGSRADVGATRVLQEAGHQFDILDSQSDFSLYKVLILPDRIPVSPGLADKIESYVANGGKLLASFEAGLNEAKTEFALPSLGVTLRDNPVVDESGELVRGRIIGWKQAHYADFIRPEGEIGKGLPSTEHVMYTKALEADATGEAQVLAPIILPYFYRTEAAFSSHMHAPSSGEIGSAGVVQNGNSIYFAHAIFELIDHFALPWAKKMVVNALELLLPEPILRHNGPSTLQTTVNLQPQHDRAIVHLLHYIPEARAQYLSVIEDVIPLFNVKLSLLLPKPIKTATLQPQGQPLSFEVDPDGRTQVEVPRLDGHQMVVFEF